MALMAACLMLSGVSKSGSPAPRPITFLPACLSARALSVTAMVGEGLMRFSVSDRKAIRNLRFFGLLVPARGAHGKRISLIRSMKHADGCHFATDTVR